MVTTIHYSQLTVAGPVATVASSLGMKYFTGLTGRRASVTDAGLLCALGAMKESTALRQHIDGFKKRCNGLLWRDMAGPWKILERYSGNHTYKEASMKRILLAILGAVIFGKLFPIILLAVILVGLGLIIKATIEEGKQL